MMSGMRSWPYQTPGLYVFIAWIPAESFPERCFPPSCRYGTHECATTRLELAR